MKLLRQKQQEALQRRQKNLAEYTTMSNIDPFPKEWAGTEALEERSVILSKKIQICVADIQCLSQKLSESFS